MRVSAVRIAWCGAILLTGIALIAPAGAHHSQSPFYDSTRKVEINGTVARFVFKNPHALIYVDAVDQTGQKVQWQVEMGSITIMQRNGWTPESIKPGDSIKVVGQSSRAEGTHGLCCAAISKPDGSPIGPQGRGRGAGPVAPLPPE